MLGSRGKSAVMPVHYQDTGCFRNLWPLYDVTYSGNAVEGIFDELQRSRKDCAGFAAYESGYTPAQHLERLEERRKERFQWRIAKLGFVGALTGALIGSILPHVPHWIAAAWNFFTHH